jgi:hypothetical protein
MIRIALFPLPTSKFDKLQIVRECLYDTSELYSSIIRWRDNAAKLCHIMLWLLRRARANAPKNKLPCNNTR